jgi:competence protein ComGC
MGNVLIVMISALLLVMIPLHAQQFKAVQLRNSAT